ncbi:MAG: hypothetical protein QM783_03670 [Phycisphaerales bacterium]
MSNERTQLARKIARVLVPFTCVLLALVCGYLALMFAWLSATPGNPAPRERAFWGLCAAVPVLLVLAVVAAVWLRAKAIPAGVCAGCGYSRSGLAEGAACPECGGRAS